MAKKKNALVIGIDIGSSMIRAISCLKQHDRALPEVLSLIEMPVEGVDRGNIIDPIEVASIIKSLVVDLEDAARRKASALVLGIGGAGLSSHHASGFARVGRGDAVVTVLDTETAIEEGKHHIIDVRNKTILHEIPLKYKLDHNDVTGSVLDLKGNKLEIKAMYVSYPKHHMAALEKMIELSSLSIQDIIAGPLAESIPLLSKKERRSGVLLLNIGATTTSLVVYENTLPILVSSLPVGGNDITRDIALSMKVTLDEAEDMKCGRAHFLYSKRRVEEIIEARIEDICNHVNKELDRIHRRELLPAGVVVTGGSSYIPKLDIMLRAHLKLPIKVETSLVAAFTRNAIEREDFARSYGLTFFAEDLKESDLFSRIIKYSFTRTKNYFSQFLP